MPKLECQLYLMAPTHCIYVRVVEVLAFLAREVRRKSISSTNSALLQLITRNPATDRGITAAEITRVVTWPVPWPDEKGRVGVVLPMLSC